MIPVGFAGASSSYSITNSIRLNGTSDYLSKTLTTSATTSGSIWVKRSKLGAVSPIFDDKVYFTSGDALYAFGLTSTALYRDPSAWLHIFWNGTGGYVNGTLVTGSGSYTAAAVTNPRLGFDGTNYFSGYLSDFAFWDGSSASLQGGATDSNGVWAPRRPSAGYSFLAFGSSGALGTDTSGNGNNWTVNGSPVQTVDTPTNNYATWNPLAVWATHPLTFSNGNNGTTVGANIGDSLGTIQFPAGKWYWEIKLLAKSSVTDAPPLYGVHRTDKPLSGGGDGVYINLGTNATYEGKTQNNISGSGLSSKWTTPAVNDVYLFAVDQTNGYIWFGKNGSWFNSGDPASGTGYIYSGLASYDLAPYIEDYQSSSSLANFGATTFAYAPPTGFNALCTTNLPSVAVTTSGTFTGNASADGPFIWTNGNPATLTINGNAVTFGTHADKTAGGFKLRSSSASYNTSGSNTWTATAGKRFVYSATSINTAQGNP